MPTPLTGTGAGFDPSKPLPAGGAAVPQTSSGAAIPTSGPGSATELRTERDKVQKQLDDLQASITQRQATNPSDVATNSENALIAQYNARIATLTQQITTAEAKPATTAISGGSTSDQYIIQTRADGTIVTDPATGKPPLNPNWDGKTQKPQSVVVGNKIVNVGTDGSVTVAYSDADAQGLAERQTAVAESNARVATLAQQTNDYAARAKVDLDQRVANGEDAASVRAEQAQKLSELHEQWVEADGDARTKQEALRDYQTDRHNTAQENLTQQQIQATRDAQAAQDATSRRGQDLQSQQAAAQTRASLTNARLQAGSAYLGNTLSTLAELNKTVDPGSDAVARMLVPLMNVGQSFFSQLGGLQSEGDVLGATPPPAGTAPPPDGTTPPPPGAVGPAAVTPTSAPVVTAGPTPSVTPEFNGSQFVPGAPNLPPSMMGVYTPGVIPDIGYIGNSSMAGTRIGASFAAGGIASSPQVASIAEQGPEAIVPLNPAAAPPATSSSGPFNILATLGAFLASLGSLNAGPNAGPPAGPTAVPPPGSVGGGAAVADPAAALAAQAASVTGNPPSAAANPSLPGSAQPGVPPQAAAAQAMARPLAPDGSPYATPQDVKSAWSGLYAKHGLQQPGAPAMAGGQ